MAGKVGEFHVNLMFRFSHLSTELGYELTKIGILHPYIMYSHLLFIITRFSII